VKGKVVAGDGVLRQVVAQQRDDLLELHATVAALVAELAEHKRVNAEQEDELANRANAIVQLREQRDDWSAVRDAEIERLTSLSDPDRALLEETRQAHAYALQASVFRAIRELRGFDHDEVAELATALLKGHYQDGGVSLPGRGPGGTRVTWSREHAAITAADVAALEAPQPGRIHYTPLVAFVAQALNIESDVLLSILNLPPNS